MMTETQNVSYGDLPSEIMDVFLPPDPGHLTGAIILIHGGAWVVGDKGVFEIGGTTFQHNFATAFLNHGFAVFDIDYALHEPNAPVPDWPQVYGSVQAAVAFIKAHAAAWNVDPNAIGAVGDSAGGQLASMLGVSGQVAFVAENSGPVDLIHAAGLDALARSMVGPTWAELKTASPIFQIGAATVPFFITQGLSDTVVNPATQSEAFNAALLAHGVSSTLVEYAGGHVFRGTTMADRWAVLDQEVAWSMQQVARLLGQMAAFGPASSAASAPVAHALSPGLFLATGEGRESRARLDRE